MHILRATIDRDRLYEKVNELLALEDNPERMAERLGLPRDLDKVKAGLVATSYKRLIGQIEKLQDFVKLEKKIADVQSGKWFWSFMGRGSTENKLAALLDKRRKFGSIIETPRWFYRQDRVWLLNAIRDAALDNSHLGDAEWADETAEALPMPVTRMLESGDVELAKKMSQELSKPLKDVSPDFVVNQLEGHRTLFFDLPKKAAFYFVPIKGI